MMMMTDPERGRSLSAVRFLANRFTRIVPLYWIYTVLLLSAVLLMPSLFTSTVINGDTLWYSFLLVPFREGTALAPILRVGWTLVYEIWFYALIAATLRLGLWWRAVLVAAVFGAVIASASSAGVETETGRYMANTMIFEFLAGMLIYMGYRSVAQMPANVALLLVTIGLLWLVSTAFIGSPTLGTRFVMWGVPAAMIVTGALYLPEAKGTIGRILAFLGDASYSIYLSHLFTIAATHTVLNFLGIMSPVLFIAAALAASVAGGALSYLVIERPLLYLTRPSPRPGRQPA
jgi:exopolysaccharide production protein ExoZ